MQRVAFSPIAGLCVFLFVCHIGGPMKNGLRYIRHLFIILWATEKTNNDVFGEIVTDDLHLLSEIQIKAICRIKVVISQKVSYRACLSKVGAYAFDLDKVKVMKILTVNIS